MSRTFSTNSGSVDSLKVSLRCGCSENARQMRCTVEIDTPVALAIERVLQCVAAAGIVSSVVVTTSAIFSSPDLARSTRAGLIGQAVQAAGRKPPAPRRHSDTRDPEPLRDRQIGHAVRREQHDLRPHRIRASDLPPPCPRLQFAPLSFVQFNPDCSSPSHAHLSLTKTSVRESQHHQYGWLFLRQDLRAIRGTWP